jgi:hypothetical protein
LENFQWLHSCDKLQHIPFEISPIQICLVIRQHWNFLYKKCWNIDAVERTQKYDRDRDGQRCTPRYTIFMSLAVKECSRCARTPALFLSLSFSRNMMKRCSYRGRVRWLTDHHIC